MTATDKDALRDLFLAAIPDETRVSAGESDRDLHAADMTFHRAVRPDLVVRPVSTEEVAAVLRVASAHGVPVTPFGAGSSLEGHVIPVRGGVSLDLTGMDRLLELDPTDLLARVQAGLTRNRLNAAAGEHGLWFPVDPGADATLGGMAATNAAGTTSVRYGKMRSQVLALEAVLADGSVVRTGTRATKTSAGYDLTSLLVGSEGTLAVITELTVRLHAIPESIVTLRLSLPDVPAACRVAAAAVAADLALLRCELLDAQTIRAVNAYAGTALPEQPTLLAELAGVPAAVEADLETLIALAADEGSEDVDVERDPTRRARLWQARHDAAHALQASMPGKRARATDTAVPVSQLAGAIEAARAACDRLGFDAAILGHAGDGNLHVHLAVDPDDADAVARAGELADALVADALARGGTCTGEHGIGLGKRRQLEAEHGDLIPLMRAIKQAFDPAGILNPGKVVPD